MKMINELTLQAEFIYAHSTCWNLKQYKYQAYCWKTEDMPDDCAVICGILNSMDGAMDKIELGELLGFAMRNVTRGNETLVYRDISEIHLFNEILSGIEKLHLISTANNIVSLTNLGRISVEENKLFKFHRATVCSYEHANITDPEDKLTSVFPFKNDMGITSSLTLGGLYWPDDNIVHNIIYDEPDSMLQYLCDQLDQPAHLFWPEKAEYFEKDSRTVKISLYKYEGIYIPVVHNLNGEYASLATEWLNHDINSDIKDYIVLECRFWQLWNNEDAVLDYQTLIPFKQFIDFELLAADVRTNWNDEQLFNLIAENATAECWRNISRHCDIDVLETKLSQYQYELNWDELSVRAEDGFLIENFLTYPWSLETISADKDRSIKTIQELILLQKDTEELWLWDELSNRLEEDFVWQHLDLVDVDLRRLTKNTEKCKQAIVQHPDRMWDWTKVETEFSLDFLVSSIRQISPFLNFGILFDRMFDVENGTDKYLKDTTFYQAIVEHDSDSRLTYLNLNQKEYRWSVENVRFLSEAQLITWASTPLLMGFESNPTLHWDRPFFEAFSSQIATADGYESVSSALDDISILIDHPSFPWNWEAISCNANLINDSELYAHYSDQLNWNILLRSVDNNLLIEKIPNIDHYLKDNQSAWSSLSEIVTVPTYIQAHRDYPWDWQVLTERMFPSLKLAGLSHPAYINKWNWTYLSENLDDAFLNENLRRFCDYWDWDVLSRRMLGEKDLKLNIDYINTIIPSINSITDEDKRTAAWHAFTSAYTFEELKTLMLRTKDNRAYTWDMSYFCSQPEFKVPNDIDECIDCIDWNALSSSPSIEAQFKYNKFCGLKPQVWWDKIRGYLDNSNYHWNFALLSHFRCFNEQQWFLEKYASSIDWNYVCAKSPLFATRDKQKLNEYLEKYKQYIDIPALANRDDVDTLQVMKLFPNVKYDYNALMQAGKWSATVDDIKTHPYYDWNWDLVCQCDTFNPDDKFLLENIEAPLDWWALSYRELEAWNSVKMIETLAEDRKLRKAVDWATLSTLESFPINQNIIIFLHDENLNWKALSKRKEINPVLTWCSDKVNWNVISRTKWFTKIDLDKSVAQRRFMHFRDLIDWSAITESCWEIMDEEFLVECEEYVDWNILSQKDYPFTKQLIERFKDRWNWAALKNNRAYYNNEEIFGKEPLHQQRIVTFLEKFTMAKPRAYHFAHMSNAIQIINDMKIQSRKAAQGKFEDSAGSNVQNTTRAYGFARFYFRPQSPTQYYNECLGRDATMGKYERTVDLKHPKCPLPVFFIIDIEELLTVMPSKCYYSTGNMQSKNTQWFRVVDNPNKLDVKGLYTTEKKYGNNKELKNAHQQEFLVENEVDLSRLNSLRICCYDEFQKEMLCEAIKDSPLVDRVEVDESLYFRKNRELTYYVDSSHVEISTDTHDEYQYKVVYEDSVPEVMNPTDIIWERGNEIGFKSSVSIGFNSPYKIYFESYGKQWLIYNNE